MASDKTAEALRAKTGECSHFTEDNTPLLCWDCCVAVMESYAKQEVEKQKRKDAETISRLLAEWREKENASFAVQDYSAASAWGCWRRAGNKIATAIEGRGVR